MRDSWGGVRAERGPPTVSSEELARNMNEMRSGAVIASLIFILPWHLGHSTTSMEKTLERRRDQAIRDGNGGRSGICAGRRWSRFGSKRCRSQLWRTAVPGVWSRDGAKESCWPVTHAAAKAWPDAVTYGPRTGPIAENLANSWDTPGPILGTGPKFPV